MCSFGLALVFIPTGHVPNTHFWLVRLSLRHFNAELFWRRTFSNIFAHRHCIICIVMVILPWLWWLCIFWRWVCCGKEWGTLVLFSRYLPCQILPNLSSIVSPSLGTSVLIELPKWKLHAFGCDSIIIVGSLCVLEEILRPEWRK